MTGHSGPMHPEPSHTGTKHAQTGGSKKSKKTKSSKKTNSKKTKKSSMPTGMGYCMSCRKRVKMINPEKKVIKMKNGSTRSQLVGKAPCGHMIYLFVKS